jgi:hypothetical protein
MQKLATWKFHGALCPTGSCATLDNLIGRSQQRFRDGEDERLGGFEIDNEFEFRRLLNR